MSCESGRRYPGSCRVALVSWTARAIRGNRATRAIAEFGFSADGGLFAVSGTTTQPIRTPVGTLQDVTYIQLFDTRTSQPIGRPIIETVGRVVAAGLSEHSGTLYGLTGNSYFGRIDLGVRDMMSTACSELKASGAGADPPQRAALLGALDRTTPASCP